MNDVEVGDLVRIEFDGERGRETVQGEVDAIDDDPDGPGNERVIEIDEAGTANQQIHYFEGDYDDAESGLVTRYRPFGGTTYRLGENGELEVL